MRILAFILNFFLPGVGSFVVGRPIQGIFQITLLVLGFFLIITVYGLVIGFPLWLIAWVWGLVTAVVGIPKKY